MSHIAVYTSLTTVYQRKVFAVVQGFRKSRSSWKCSFINGKHETDKCRRFIDDKKKKIYIYIATINIQTKRQGNVPMSLCLQSKLLNVSFRKHRYSTKSAVFVAFESDLFPHINNSFLQNPLPSPLKTAVFYIFYWSKKTPRTRKCVENIDGRLNTRFERTKEWKKQSHAS